MTDTAITNEAVVTDAAPVEAPAPSLWYETLPDEYKTNKNITNFKDPSELVKSYLHQTSMLGKKVHEWAAEDVTRLHGKLGRPESHTEYKFADEMAADAREDFAKKAFEAGLTQEQAKILADKFIENGRAAAEAEAKAEADLKKAWADDLRNEFGAAYDKRLDTARRAFNELADDGLKELITATGLAEHPAMIKLFSKLGKDFLEPDRIVKSDSDTRFGITPAEAQARINMKMADAEFKKAYFSGTHHAHKAAVAEIADLYKLAGK
jgi:hypothetical protein